MAPKYDLWRGPTDAELNHLLKEAGLPTEPEGSMRVNMFGGEGSQLLSSFRVADAGQLALSAFLTAVSMLWQARSGRRVEGAVSKASAIAECMSERLLKVDGHPPADLWDSLAGTYQAAQGGYIRIHTNFPHHRDAALALFECEPNREALSEAVLQHTAEHWEAEAIKYGALVFALRNFADWDQSPQGKAVAEEPLIAMRRFGDAPPRQFEPAPARTLSGIKILDLTRIIAGPVAGRSLAAHGADVMLVSAPHLPSVTPLVMDTGRGKRSCFLDLREKGDRAAMRDLVARSDIVIQSYRPGALERLGFGPDDLAKIRPGLVTVSISAWGWGGPWAGYRGFDSLVQAASGFNLAEAEAFGQETPRALPAQILDHATGHLAAFAGLAARLRQSREGGNWDIRLSLARTGLWLRSLGSTQRDASFHEITQDTLDHCLEEMPSRFGLLRASKHAAKLKGIPVRWDRPSVPLGTHRPEW